MFFQICFFIFFTLLISCGPANSSNNLATILAVGQNISGLGCRGLSQNTTATTVYGQGGSFTSAVQDNGGSAGCSGICPTADSIWGPESLSLDASGNLYLADRMNNRILFYSIGSTTATQIFGQSNFSTNTTSSASSSMMSNPTSVSVDPFGNVFVADGSFNRVIVFQFGSTFANTVYGQTGSFTSTTANKGGISAASLNIPMGVKADSDGNLYIADSGNNRVLFYPVGSTTATRVYGQSGSFTTNTDNKGGISANSLSSPNAIAIDGSGGVYISDTSNRRVLFFPSGSTTATRVYGQNNNFTSNVYNNGGVSANSLSFPGALALDINSNLFITDTYNHRVLFFPSGSTTATRVYGQEGSFTIATDNKGGISANSLSWPSAVDVDCLGGVYIGDGSNQRVLIY